MTSNYTPKLNDSNNRHLGLLLAICFGGLFYGISIGLDFVAIPLFFAKRGVSKTMMGIIMSSEVLAWVLIVPFFAKIVNKLGIKKIIILSIVVRNIGLILIPNSSKVVSWITSYIIFGTGGFMLFNVMQFSVNNSSTTKNRAISLGAITSAMSVGIAIGPILFKFIHSRELYPFYLSILVSFLAIIPFSFIWNSLKYNKEQRTKVSILAVAKASPVIIVGAILVDFVYFSLSSFLVLYGISHGLSEQKASTLVVAMILGSVFLDIPIGILADILSRKKTMIFCSITMLALSNIIDKFILHSVASFAIFFFWCGALNGIYICCLALLGDRFKNQDLAEANSAFAVAGCLGSFVGTISTGVMMDAMGPRGLPFIISCATMVFLVVSISFYNKKYVSTGI